MGFRQTYKGIFQFRNQDALVRAMAENQSEASGADAMGLQDSYHSEGVMLLSIDAVATEQDWEEMAVAMATLAMHASSGFLYAVAFNGEAGEKSEVEYYEATSGRRKSLPANHPVTPENDFFPLHEGSYYKFVSGGADPRRLELHVHKVEVHGQDYYYLVNPETADRHYNEALDTAYFCKDKSFISTVGAGNERELHSIDPENPRSFQLIYSNSSQPGDVLYAIWKSGDCFVVYTHESNVDLELPAGRFPQCMKVRVETYHVQEENMRHETQYQYFAKGVGLVRYQRGELVFDLTESHVAR